MATMGGGGLDCSKIVGKYQHGQSQFARKITRKLTREEFRMNRKRVPRAHHTSTLRYLVVVVWIVLVTFLVLCVVVGGFTR